MLFRLFVDEPANAAFNMAVDEALFVSALELEAIPTVRLYGFHPPAVSCGYRQRAEEVIDLEACRTLGIDFVRRSTGGRAILHQHELTYAVASPITSAFRGLSVRSVYDFVTKAIRIGIGRVSIPLDPVASLAGTAAEPDSFLPCLASPARHEITSGGLKIVASAQRRTSRAFLQHGSILRKVDRELWEKLRPKASPATPLAAIGIDEVAPASVSRDDLVRAVRLGFEQVFGAPAVLEGLTASEELRLGALENKYRSEGWSLRKELPQGFSATVSRAVDNSEAVW